MAIKYDLIPEMSLDDFAEAYGLVMVVHERPRQIDDPMRFYAMFKGVEESDGCLLVGLYGNGRTAEEAIKAYVKMISLKKLVINAMSPDRRTIAPTRITD